MDPTSSDKEEVPWYHKITRKLNLTEIEDLQELGIFLSSGRWSQMEIHTLYNNWLTYNMGNVFDASQLEIFIDKLVGRSNELRQNLIPILSAGLHKREGHIVYKKFVEFGRRGWPEMKNVAAGTPWFHTLTNIKEEQMELLKEQGVKIKTGRFSRAENEKLKQNWQCFSGKQWEESMEELRIWTGTEKKSHSQTIKRVQFISTLCVGLFNRTGMQVYERFRIMAFNILTDSSKEDSLRRMDAFAMKNERVSVSKALKLGVTPNRLTSFIRNPSKYERIILNDKYIIEFVMEQFQVTEEETFILPVNNIDFVVIAAQVAVFPSVAKDHWLKLRKKRTLKDNYRWLNAEILDVLRTIRDSNAKTVDEIDWDLIAQGANIRPILKDSVEIKEKIKLVNEKAQRKKVSEIYGIQAVSEDVDPQKANVLDMLNELIELYEQLPADVAVLELEDELEHNIHHSSSSKNIKHGQSFQFDQQPKFKAKNMPMQPFLNILSAHAKRDSVRFNFKLLSVLHPEHIQCPKQARKAWNKLVHIVPQQKSTCSYLILKYLRRLVRKRKVELPEDFTVKKFIKCVS